MTDGNTLIVDVVSSGDGYMLNDTPVNMMIAYEVVRRHVTDNGTFYSQMTMKQKTAEGYVFKFDTGDVFESASDTAYPTAESVSDSTDELPAVGSDDKGKFLHTNESTGALEWAEGGSGGGVLVVTDTDGTLDKTWQEIHDADFAVIRGSGGYRYPVLICMDTGSRYLVSSTYYNGDEFADISWTTNAVNDYPER